MQFLSIYSFALTRKIYFAFCKCVAVLLFTCDILCASFNLPLSLKILTKTLLALLSFSTGRFITGPTFIEARKYAKV